MNVILKLAFLILLLFTMVLAGCATKSERGSPVLVAADVQAVVGRSSF